MSRLRAVGYVQRPGAALVRTSAAGALLVVVLFVAVATTTAEAAGPPSVVSAFTATSAELGWGGGTIQLSASVQNATSCTLRSSPAVDGLPATIDCASGGATRTITLPTNTTTKPKTYTFRLTASGTGKSAQADPVTVTVDAQPAPSVASFGATPVELAAAGGAIQLSASVQNATSCTLRSSPAVDGLPATIDCASGGATRTITLPTNTTTKPKTYTFRLTASGTGKSAQADPVTVTVDAQPAPSVASFGATPVELAAAGGAIQLSASVQNATSCTLRSSPAVDGLPATIDCASGGATRTITLPTNTTTKPKTYTFRLTASGTGKSAQADPVTVTVQPAGSPIDITPPSPVTALVAHAGPAGISLAWTNPPDPDLAALIARRTLGFTAPSSVGDGDAVATIAPPAGQLTDGTLGNDGTTYSYSIFARDTSGNVSRAASVTVATLDTTAPASVAALQATVSGQSVHLTWTDPPDADVAGVVIRRSDGSTAPSGPTDGTAVATLGVLETAFDDASVSSGQTYTYAIFARDQSANYSVPAVARVTIESAPVVHVCGTIASDTTWPAATGQIVEVDCTVTVPRGVTLTVPAGSVVKFDGGAIDITGGTLIADGTTTAPITFTSIHDPAPGGATDTNRPPAPGDWHGLTVRDATDEQGQSAGGGRIEISHARIAFGGAVLQTTPCGGCGHGYPAEQSSIDLDHVAVEQSSAGIDNSFGMLGSVSVANSSFDRDTGGAQIWADSVLVTNNTFQATGGPSALSVTSPNTPRIHDNTISATTGQSAGQGCTPDSFCQQPTVFISSPKLDLSQLANNTGTNNAQQSFQIHGTLTADGSLATLPNGWTPILSQLTVPRGVTLTVPAGSVVKFDGGAIDITGGTLIADGTTTAPITFTSIHDPAPGGATDTNRPPAPGDWHGLTVRDATDEQGQSAGGGRIEISHARIAFGGAVLQTTPCGGCGHGYPAEQSSIDLDHVAVEQSSAGIDNSFGMLGSVSVANSSFDRDTGGAQIWADSVLVTNNTFQATGGPSALSVTSPNTPRIHDNTISATTGQSAGQGCTPDSFCQQPTVFISSPKLDLSQLANNTGTNNAQQSFQIHGTLTADGSLATLPNGWTPILSQLTVPRGVTLTVPAGSVVKFDGGAIDITGGTLIADGTTTAPITFTSIHDPAPGGATDTNRPPAPGDWHGLTVRDATDEQGQSAGGGRIEISHARIAFGGAVLQTTPCGGCGHGYPAEQSSIDLDHVAVEQSSAGIDNSFGMLGSVSVANSSFDRDTGGAQIWADSVLVTNNTFQATGGPSALSVTSPNTPRIHDNTISATTGQSAGQGCTPDSFCQQPTVFISSPKLDLSQLANNTGTNNAQQSFQIHGTLTADGSLATLPNGWTPILSQLTVPRGVTLTVPAGSVVKFDGGAIDITGGTLIADGTTTAPITFTSIHDPAPGGATDTNRPPAPGDWHGLTVRDAGTLTASAITVKYAVTAFDFSEGDGHLSQARAQNSNADLDVLVGHVSLRGSGMRITACGWGEPCSVDAAYTYWDSSSGPFPDSGSLVCGAVTTSPWLTTGDASGPTASDANLYRDGNCGGGPTPDARLASAQQTAAQRLEPYRINCGQGFEDACRVIEDYERCFGAAVGLAASQAPFPISTPDVVVDAGTEYLQGSETAIVSSIGEVLAFGASVVHAVGTILEIADAYTTCAPSS